MTISEAMAKIQKLVDEQGVRMTEAMDEVVHSYEMGARHGLCWALEILQEAA